MANKRGAADSSAEETELVKRVDAIMTGQPQANDLKPDVKIIKPTVDEIPIADLKTAPELPEHLLKTVKTDEGPLAAKEPDPAPEPEPEAKPESEPTISELAENAVVESTETDKAVDDIVAKESDLLLAVDDAKAAKRTTATAPKSGWKASLKSFFRNKWTWIGLAVVLLIVFGLPLTRYKVLGLLLKEPVTVSVLDSTTKTPVSGAVVNIAGNSAKTDNEGQAMFKAKLGQQTVSVTKQYYKAGSKPLFVGFKHGSTAILLTATGRLVPITVTNSITGKPLANATIQVLKTTVKTNSKGLVTVALPTGNAADSAQISLGGYNTAAISIQVTSSAVKTNDFELTPAGQVYFLSNLSGNIDVVKTNLDGSGRKTVFAGTGNEDKNSTSLLASRDWRYLVLESNRDGSHPSLYLIDTSNDKITEFQNTDSTINLIGWSGHDFMYDLINNAEPNSQAGREAIKSYDADHQQLNQLDQDQTDGTATSYGYQSFGNFYIVNNVLVYSVQWFSSYNPSFDLSGKTASIRADQPNGQGKKDYQTFPANTTGSMQAALYQPQAVYFAVYDNGSNQTQFYDYEDQAVKTASITQTVFNQGYPTFLESPSGNRTFWTELRDGKNTLFTGDPSAASPTTIASASDYSPYGWFTDNYVLVSKNSSELYIMPASGTNSGGQVLKISDYYKPAQNFPGYGGGYGGL